MAVPLAHPASGVEALEIELLLTAIVRHYGYDFTNYSRGSLRRRIHRAVEAERVGTISALQERILREPGCLERFVTTMSVHATAMFRDPEFFLALRNEVVPVLRTYPFIRIWAAGCSTGEEVYSLAILLEEEGLYPRCRFYATDLSNTLLERAARGVFPLASMRVNTKNYVSAGGKREFSHYYTADDKRVLFRQDLRRNMVFSQHNLVSDSAFNEFNLILCRNVMIYFDAPLRRRVQQLLYESLARLGVLGLGREESLDVSPLRRRFELLSPLTRLYRKER